MLPSGKVLGILASLNKIGLYQTNVGNLGILLIDNKIK